MKLAPIQSLAQLRTKATKDEKYRKLAINAAENLGGEPDMGLSDALDFLYVTAKESDEDDVVEEINFLLDDVE